MTLIACTADYAAMLGKLVSSEKGMGVEAAWAFHVVKRHRSNLAVAMHERTRMGWFVPNLRKPEFPHMPDLLKELVRDTGAAMQLPEDRVRDWLDRELPEDITYVCGINRSIQSHIRQGIEFYDWSDEADYLPHSVPAWQALSYKLLQYRPAGQKVNGRQVTFFPDQRFREEVMTVSEASS